METKTKKKTQTEISKTTRVVCWFLMILIATGLFVTPSITQAATLGVSSSAAQVTVGKTFTIRVSVNTQDKTINNAEGTIKFPTDIVEVVSVSSGGSIFTLWVEPPAFSNGSGSISFNGGVPNPGFKGSGNIMSAVVRAKKVGTANFTFSGAAVRENDGLGTNILTGSGRASVAIIDATKPEPEEEEPAEPEDTTFERVVITSPTHPDRTKWYRETTAVFNWRIPRGATASQTTFDRNPNATPSVIRRPAISTITMENIEDGEWYLRARFQVDGNWSPIYSYKVQVDSTPPTNVQAIFESNNEGRLIAKLTAIDQTSQLDHYTLQIDSEAPITVPAAPGETLTSLPVLSPEKHTITVVAYDKAGNSTSIVQEFTGIGGDSVKITDYTEEIKANEPIKINGVGPANTTIRISLVTQEGLTRYYYVQSNASGDFAFVSEPVVGGGMYTARAEVEDGQGGIRLPSEPVNIRVKQSLVTKSIEIASLLKRLITPQNVAISLLALIAFVGWFKYLRLRKKVRRGVGQKSGVKSLSAMIGKKLKK